MKCFLLFFLIVSGLPTAAVSQDSLRVMFYNLYRFPDNSPANREYLLQGIMEKTQPDLLMACEIISKDGSDRIASTAFRNLPDSFSAPPFVYDPNMGDDPLQQMVYFNTRKLTFVAADYIPTPVRQINHYLFYVNQLTVTPADTIFLDIFVTHLKAGSSNADKQLRLSMIDSFASALTHIPSSHFILLAGDMNFYDDTEPAFIKITDTLNSHLIVDPIHSPGDWHDNEDFKAIHTQATRVTVDGFGLGGASGGMDDRFDFIFISKNLETDNDLSYSYGSYKAIGNNGNCFNKAINDPMCTGGYDLPFRNLLFQMSDHTPIMMTLGIKGKFPTLGIRHSPDPQKGMISFPRGNVTRQELIITLTDPFPKFPEELNVYDLMGRLYLTRRIEKGHDSINLDVSGWAQGMYLIRYKQSSAKFIRN